MLRIGDRPLSISLLLMRDARSLLPRACDRCSRVQGPTFSVVWLVLVYSPSMIKFNFSCSVRHSRVALVRALRRHTPYCPRWKTRRLVGRRERCSVAGLNVNRQSGSAAGATDAVLFEGVKLSCMYLCILQVSHSAWLLLLWVTYLHQKTKPGDYARLNVHSSQIIKALL